jgi:flagellar protein FliL
MAKEEEKKEAAPAADAPTGSSGNKLGTTLSVLNLFLTLAIGAVVFVQFKKDKNNEQVADLSTHEPAAVTESAGSAHESGGHGGESSESGDKNKAKTEKQTVVSLDQFTVNLSTAVGAPPKFARVVIAVEVVNEETSRELNMKMPQVRNSIIDLFNSKRPADLQTGEGRNYLKEEIRNALNSFLVTGKIKGIFFSNFSVSS